MLLLLTNMSVVLSIVLYTLNIWLILSS